MVRCTYTIPSTKRKCQKNAADGSCYCTIHKKYELLSDIPEEEQPQVVIQLEPQPQPNHTNPEIQEVPIMPAREIQMQDISEEVEQQVTNNTSYKTSSTELQDQIDNLAQVVEKLTMALNEKCSIQNKDQKQNKSPSKITDKMVYKKAQSIYYKDFKSKHTDVIENMTQAAIKANIMLPNTKLPWVHIKYASDQYFNGLEEVCKRMYLDSARTLLNNKNHSDRVA